MRANRRVAPVCMAAALTLISGCSYLQFLPFLKSPVDTSPEGAHSTKRGPAFGRRAAGAPDATNDWPAYNGDITTSWRYSALTMINRSNASSLAPVCVADLGQQTPMQSGPVVIGGVMYVTSGTNTWAIDAVTCAMIWRHTYAYRPKPDYDLKTNRGVGYIGYPDGALLVRGSNDGRVYALDASTGEEVWNVLEGDVSRGETFPGAPISWHGVVFIGNAGGDNYGVGGRMMALDAKTGNELWRTELIAHSGAAGATWPAESDRFPRGGGATWTSYTLDTLTTTLYLSTGNAAPDFIASVREGRNDFAYSIVAIDARTGAITTSYKLLTRDVHDWDVAAAPLLLSAGGHALAVAAGKDGYLYAVDRAAGGIAYRTATTTIENVDAPLTAQGTRFCPGVQGGTEWNGPAYSPALNRLYVSAVDWCSTIQTEPPDKLEGKNGIPWTGSAKLTQPFGKMDPLEKAHGWLTSIDATSGQVSWKYESPTPLVAGVVTTAGGIVVSADLQGHVFALDAATGTKLWSFDVAEPVGGGVVTYAAGGRQYVAVAAGLHAPLSWQTKSGSAKIVVFSVPR